MAALVTLYLQMVSFSALHLILHFCLMINHQYDPRKTGKSGTVAHLWQCILYISFICISIIYLMHTIHIFVVMHTFSLLSFVVMHTIHVFYMHCIIYCNAHYTYLSCNAYIYIIIMCCNAYYTCLLCGGCR